MKELLDLGTRIRFISKTNGQEFGGIICGYPAIEDTYDVAHAGRIYQMTTDEFIVHSGPCDEKIQALEAKIAMLEEIALPATVVDAYDALNRAYRLRSQEGDAPLIKAAGDLWFHLEDVVKRAKRVMGTLRRIE